MKLSCIAISTHLLIIISCLSIFTYFIIKQHITLDYFKFDKEYLTCQAFGIPYMVACFYQTNNTFYSYENVSYETYEYCFNQANFTCDLYIDCNDNSNELYTRPSCYSAFINDRFTFIIIELIVLIVSLVTITNLCVFQRRRRYANLNNANPDMELMLHQNSFYNEVYEPEPPKYGELITFKDEDETITNIAANNINSEHSINK